MTEINIQERKRLAEEILKNPLYQEIFNLTREDITKEWATAHSQETRESKWYELQALNRIASILDGAIRDAAYERLKNRSSSSNKTEKI